MDQILLRLIILIIIMSFEMLSGQKEGAHTKVSGGIDGDNICI